MAASTPSAPIRVGFRTSSCLRVLLAPTRSRKVFGAPPRRAQLWAPARRLAKPSLGSVPMRLLPRSLALVLLLAGCGAEALNHDVAGFTQAGATPTQQSILRSIATYRMTDDEAKACRLITTQDRKSVV